MLSVQQWYLVIASVGAGLIVGTFVGPRPIDPATTTATTKEATTHERHPPGPTVDRHMGLAAYRQSVAGFYAASSPSPPWQIFWRDRERSLAKLNRPPRLPHQAAIGVPPLRSGSTLVAWAAAVVAALGCMAAGEQANRRWPTKIWVEIPTSTWLTASDFRVEQTAAVWTRRAAGAVLAVGGVLAVVTP